MHGVSTRSVDDLVDALGAPSGIKKSHVSRICAGLDETSRRSAPAASIMEFPYLYLDATYLHVRNTTGQLLMAVVIATGISATAVNTKCSASTSATARTKRSGEAFLRSLRRRGLGGVALVISTTVTPAPRRERAKPASAPVPSTPTRSSGPNRYSQACKSANPAVVVGKDQTPSSSPLASRRRRHGHPGGCRLHR